MREKIAAFFTSKYKLITVIIFCILLMIASLFTDRLATPLKAVVSTVVVPIQKGINYLGLITNDKYVSFEDNKKLREENENLKSRLDDLTEENNRLKQDTYELSRLRDLYQLDGMYDSYKKTAARIIGTNSDNWFTTFTVNKGSNDGIEKNMNVVAGQGLVGLVTEVGSNYCVVRSVIEDGSYVSGQLIDSGDKCIISGDIKLMDKGIIKCSGFNSSVEVKDGDKIVTSNISDKYLPGILIGYAKDVKMDSNNLTQSGYIIPVVDFAHLQEVLIITDKKKSGD